MDQGLEGRGPSDLTGPVPVLSMTYATSPLIPLLTAATVALYIALRRERHKVQTRVEYTGEDKWTMKVTVTNWSEFPIFVEGSYFKYSLPKAAACAQASFVESGC